MDEIGCPNCNGHLAPYRTDRQSAGRHVIRLEWFICPECRHVALERWSFEEVEAKEVAPTARPPIMEPASRMSYRSQR